MTDLITELGRLAAAAEEHAELAVSCNRDADAVELFLIQERADDLLKALAATAGGVLPIDPPPARVVAVGIDRVMGG